MAFYKWNNDGLDDGEGLDDEGSLILLCMNLPIDKVYAWNISHNAEPVQVILSKHILA